MAERGSQPPEDTGEPEPDHTPGRKSEDAERDSAGPSFGPRYSTASQPPPSRWAQTLQRVKNPLWSLAALVIVVAGLKEAKAVLVPVALAALLAIIVSSEPVSSVRWPYATPSYLARFEEASAVATM